MASPKSEPPQSSPASGRVRQRDSSGQVHVRRRASSVLQAQRIHERTTIAVPVRFEGPTGWLEGTARNISIGGLYVETKTPLPFETKCNLVLYTGGSEVPVTARVRWVDASGMGIQFLEMGARETHAIVKLMGG